MNYYYNTILHQTSFDDAIALTTRELQKQGFGVLTQIDVKQTLKQKIDAQFRPYIILGACNPGFAHQALQIESKIGVLLPCNVVIEQHENGDIEVSAIDPVAMMNTVENPQLQEIAQEVRERMLKVMGGVAGES